jgi:hypothetical protein
MLDGSDGARVPAMDGAFFGAFFISFFHVPCFLLERAKSPNHTTHPHDNPNPIPIYILD